MADAGPRASGWVGLAVLLAAITACRGAPEPARHVVLISVDTWRGDHFVAERAGQALAPELARWAEAGVRFAEAHSAGNETSPGTAGILTGLLPRRSGVVVNAHVLPEEVPTLAEVLAEAGFATEAVVGNFVLRSGMGFEQGFEGYQLVHRRPKAGAEEVTDAALARLAAREADLGAGRVFLWVHYMDPHGPYLPPEEDLALFPREEFEAPRDIPLLPRGDQSGLRGIPSYQQVGLSPPSRDGRDYLARYAAEVHAMDRHVGRLLAELDRRGILEHAVVVLTSDHGEALAGDHGYYFSHGNDLTRDQLHVPLVVVCPGCPAGRVVDRPVSTLGIVPTVLERVGVALPQGHALDGEPLLGQVGEGLVYSETRHQVALRKGGWKAVWNRRAPGPASPSVHLYDLSRDPGESRDLAVSFPGRLEELAAALRRLRAREALAEPRLRQLPGRQERRDLQALGYL